MPGRKGEAKTVALPRCELAEQSAKLQGFERPVAEVMQQNVLFGHNEISFYMTKMPDTTSAVRY